MTNSPSSFDDEIDLHAILQTLWTARKAILIVTLAAAMAAFIVSYWILPRKYQATAYVFVGNPVVTFTQTSGLTISPTLPDIKAVVELAAAPGLLESVTQDPAVASAIGNEDLTIADMAAALDVGKDQVRLQVTDTDPQRAALLANTWAQKVTGVVNATYGMGAVAQTLDAQVLQSQQNYAQAQAALEEALSRSRVDALNAQLQREQADLKCVLNSASQATRVLADLQALEQGLNSLAAESPVSLGDGLALSTLRQRSLTSQPCLLDVKSPLLSVSMPAASDYVLQIDGATFAGMTAPKALAATTQMRAALQTQLTRLRSDQNHLEQEIPQLEKDAENAQAQLTQFTVKRDQSRDIQNDFLQQQRIATVLAQNAKVASVSVQAVPSQKENSPKVLMNTIVSAFIGLILSMLGALAIDWWTKE